MVQSHNLTFLSSRETALRTQLQKEVPSGATGVDRQSWVKAPKVGLSLGSGLGLEQDGLRGDPFCQSGLRDTRGIATAGPASFQVCG